MPPKFREISTRVRERSIALEPAAFPCGCFASSGRAKQVGADAEGARQRCCAPGPLDSRSESPPVRELSAAATASTLKSLRVVLEPSRR